MIGRRQILVALTAVLSLAAISCERKTAPVKVPDAVGPLCDHIVQTRRMMIVDTNQAEIVWSDGVLLEIGTNFPAPLQALISRPTHYHDIRSSIHGFNFPGDEWKPATFIRTVGFDGHFTVRSVDGKISMPVDRLYVDYLDQRYPEARVFVKGELEPVAIASAGELRACLMPFKR